MISSYYGWCSFGEFLNCEYLVVLADPVAELWGEWVAVWVLEGHVLRDVRVEGRGEIVLVRVVLFENLFGLFTVVRTLLELRAIDCHFCDDSLDSHEVIH